jgi:LuxR family maltose regulon positive regulatory protein
LLGVAELLDGDAATAERTLQAAVEHAAHQDAWLIVSLGYAELSLLAQSKDLWSLADDLARRAAEAATRFDSELHAGGALAHVACARSALRNSDWTRAGNEIDRVQLLLPRLTTALPWLSGQVRLELARVHLALNDLAGAGELAEDLNRLLLARPHLGTLRSAAVDLRQQIEELQDHPSGRASSLTAAELRLLPLLTTHLSFRQIADHLYVSRNTVKTQAISVYRKLGVTSRTEAIERAVEYGLLRPEGEVVSRRA